MSDLDKIRQRHFDIPQDGLFELTPPQARVVIV